ncbi:MAG: KpsF/GutQ family sugar-phosphate isomerase [Gemmatimonadales bacterium]|nr:MAG: KpsF/GutQ family sugar-phosphate isomerase [Gemmatimonadales bacterium]
MSELPVREIDDGRILSRGREVLRIESASVDALREHLGDEFVAAVRLIFKLTGRLIVTGMGKSGGVARKLASTFSSTGTPAIFLHPAEGIHGDLGMLVAGDGVMILSKSGESDEIAALMPTIRHLQLPIIAMTSVGSSRLARDADIVLDIGVVVEACPLDLAPTASSTASLAMGDALAIALAELREFTAEDFARLHPGGELGRRLTWLVRDVMVTGADSVPRLRPHDLLAVATHEIAHRRGTVPVLDSDERVVGVLTAGDLTRLAASHPDFLTRRVDEAMNSSPHTITPDAMATDAAVCLRLHGIMALPVVSPEGKLLGIIHLHDLLKAGIV